MKKFGVRTIVAIAIGAAIFFVLGRFAAIPVFANTYLSLQFGVLGFFAAVFGPIAGLFIALIGHVLIDLTFGSIWWSWVIASAVVGLLMGILYRKVNVDDGKLSGKDVVRFVIGTIVAQAVGYGIVAPGLDVLIYEEPFSKVITQGLIAAGLNTVVTLVIGLLLLFLYSKTRSGKGSLSKD